MSKRKSKARKKQSSVASALMSGAGQRVEPVDSKPPSASEQEADELSSARPNTTKRPRDRPWIIRTYSGHSTAAKSNKLYKQNLAKGQTGLSIAFDLPTQTGYDGDHVLARGEVGKVGVPICHLGDMRTLMAGIPLDQMNTSMTINATAPWLLALYICVADEQGVDRNSLTGTVQNDIIKEYLSRGTYIFPPEPSVRLIRQVITFCHGELPKWNPTNVCSYHLQEAGATPVQELAFALATAEAVLDAVKSSDEIPADRFSAVVGRLSFFVNAGLHFVTEMCKMRAFTQLWDEICKDRYCVTDPKLRRFRYGVQVNSLGLSEQQPENNVYRILLEMLAVTLSKDARARAIQLPAWNEALGLPRPFDQQWSLRMQQILAHETDLLDYDDLFEGSTVVAAKVASLKAEALAELEKIRAMGGALAAIDYMKRSLVESNAQRLRAIESGEQVVVGVNKWTQSEPSPLSAGGAAAILAIDATVEVEQLKDLHAWRAARDDDAVRQALSELRKAVKTGDNIMSPSIICAKAGATTGEWAAVLRDVFGEYRAPTGVGQSVTGKYQDFDIGNLRAQVEMVSQQLGRRVKLLVGKPGLDGHSNGAEQIAMRASECGMEVVYQGIRLTPRQIVRSALEEAVHIIGLSILSGSHMALVRDVLAEMTAQGIDDIPLVLGGIIPPADAEILRREGIAAIYTPKDFLLDNIMIDIVDLVNQR